MVNLVYEVRNINDPILGETPRFASEQEAFDVAREFNGAEVFVLYYDEDWNFVKEEQIEEGGQLPDGCDSCSGDNPDNYDEDGNFRLPELDDDLDERFFPKEFYDQFKFFRGTEADCLKFRDTVLNANDVLIVKDGMVKDEANPEYEITFTKAQLQNPENWESFEQETYGDELKSKKGETQAPVDEAIEKKELVKESLPPFRSGEPIDYEQVELDYANDDVYYKGKKVIAVQQPHDLAAEQYSYYLEEEGITEADLTDYPMCEDGILTKDAWMKFVDNADPSQYWLDWANLFNEMDLTETDLIFEGDNLDEISTSTPTTKPAETEPEDDDNLFNESFTQSEQDEFMELSKKLGFKNFGDVLKFSKEHGSIFDQELLQAMRDEAEKLANDAFNMEFDDNTPQDVEEEK